MHVWIGLDRAAMLPRARARATDDTSVGALYDMEAEYLRLAGDDDECGVGGFPDPGVLRSVLSSRTMPSYSSPALPHVFSSMMRDLGSRAARKAAVIAFLPRLSWRVARDHEPVRASLGLGDVFQAARRI
jgi:hypothetical protein